MFDVTNFLMRWLFLSNLIRDASNVQTLPYNPPVATSQPPQHSHSHPHSQEEYHHKIPLDTSYPAQYSHQQHPYHPTPPPPPPASPSLSTATTSVSCEDEWRAHCLRGIASYPPGTQRLLILDAMRAELVEQLSWELQKADQTVEQYEARRRRERELAWHQQQQQQQQQLQSSSSPALVEDDEWSEDDPYMDADVEILKAFEQETAVNNKNPDSNSEFDSEQDGNEASADEEQALLVISNNGTVQTNDMQQQQQSNSILSSQSLDDGSVEIDDRIPQITSEQAEDAQRTIRVVRDYLPQLVSVVLKSPPAFDPRLIDPVDKLRQIILRRCVDDANWGVDMCWLLEAEVGRAWKTLFEHRQQTGRRLIVVLPAEKAAVLAKIGSEKREAFDLLQDAEQATAFGYTIPMDEDLFYHRPRYSNQHHQNRNDPARLPSSLSLRRCSHFGDTMHFIDRLTKISLDLRRVPTIHRDTFLQESLHEMNRRVRRRMVTRGDVSLDVEDHRGPNDWPTITDITADMLRYSVHLPVDPKVGKEVWRCSVHSTVVLLTCLFCLKTFKQNKRWPGGDPASDVSPPGAVRILNVVVEDCRMLASRERCPYLVHLEVAETGLRGSDSRLYASGAPGLGATIEEALALSAQATSAAATTEANHGTPSYGNYHIPNELLSTTPVNTNRIGIRVKNSNMTKSAMPERQMNMPRGGWQADEAFYSHNPEDIFVSNPYDSVRENEYQQLHEQMHSEYGMVDQPIEQR
jgi:hypothetical protein